MEGDLNTIDKNTFWIGSGWSSDYDKKDKLNSIYLFQANHPVKKNFKKNGIKTTIHVEILIFLILKN